MCQLKLLKILHYKKKTNKKHAKINNLDIFDYEWDSLLKLLKKKSNFNKIFVILPLASPFSPSTIGLTLLASPIWSHRTNSLKILNSYFSLFYFSLALTLGFWLPDPHSGGSPKWKSTGPFFKSLCFKAGEAKIDSTHTSCGHRFTLKIDVNNSSTPLVLFSNAILANLVHNGSIF